MGERARALKAAFLATLPVMAGYLFLGFAYGVLMHTKGPGLLWAAAMSVFVYAGSMQFVAADFFAGGFSLMSIAAITFLVNIRHVFYGLSMLGPFKNTGRAKPYMIFSLTDETYSLLCSARPLQDVPHGSFMFFAAVLDQLYWITGTIAGALAGSALPFDATGIDFAMTALFVVIFVEQWKNTKNHFAAITGLVGSALCLAVFGAGSFILPSMALMVIVLSAFRKEIPKEEEQ